MFVVLATVVVLGLGVGAFLGIRGLGNTESDGPKSEKGTGVVFSPPGKQYSVEIPRGVVKVPLREDRAIPSDTDLSLELEGKVQAGGLIKIGTLAGPAATGSFDAVGEEAADRYSSQYEGNPGEWGTGAKVDEKTTEVGGREAVEINARFSPSGDAEPSVFFRIFFVDPPSGSPILITCDWHTDGTEDIRDACDSFVASFRVRT